MIGQFNPIRFPNVLHIRVDDEMMAEVKARGGGPWVRALIAANARPPTGVDRVARVTRRKAPSSEVGRRVSLDKIRQGRLKPRVSRKA